MSNTERTTTTVLTSDDIRPGDVVRTRRLGNKTTANYVIDRIAVVQPGETCIAVFCHREHGVGRPRYMLLDGRGARVIRSYA